MAQTIQIRRGTGSAVPSSLASGELAINTETGKFYYGNGSTVSSDFRVDSITAENYVVSSSVTSYTFQALSGSTDFGDDIGDIHNRTGSVNVSGSISIATDLSVAGNLTVAPGSVVGNHIKLGNSTLDTNGDFVISGSSVGNPLITLKQSAQTVGYGSPGIKFARTEANSDGSAIGLITYTSPDSADNITTYVRVTGKIEEKQSGQEGGKYTVEIASHDGELQPGLTIEDGDAEDEVDVTIGNTATSETTIAGTLTIGSTAFVNNSGVIQVATQGTIDHDSLANFVANEHIDHSSVSITAGAGLTGGGTIAATRDIAVGAGTGVTVNANDVAIGQDVATTANVLFNNITATGNVSASGHVQGDRIYAGPLIFGSSPSADKIRIGFDSSVDFLEYGKEATTSHFFKGNITASGDISASGDIEVNQILFDNGNHIVGHHVNDGLQIRTQNAEPIVFKTNGNNIRASIASDGVVNIVGNLDLDGNVIGDGATDISGIDQITTSTLRLTSTTDASVSSTGHAFQAGATNSTNVIIDNNEIMARNNGAVSNLHVNPDGGIITFNNSVSGDAVLIGNGHITASGNISGSSTSTILTGGTISSRDNIFLGEGSFANHILHFGPSAGVKTYPVINANANYELQIQRGSLETPLMKFFMRQHSAEPDTVHISGSLKVKTGPTTGTGHLEVEGNVTASGGISASSTIYAPRIDFNPGSSYDYIDRSDTYGVLIKPSDNKITLLGNVTASGNISSTTGIIKAGWHNSPTRIKILVSDFIPDDIGRPAMIDDTGSDRWLESHGTGILFASIPIPTGFKATHVHIYGSATSALEVSEMNINSKTVTSKGTGNIGTELNITDVTSTATNYLLLELAQASGEEVYGGYVTIAAV